MSFLWRRLAATGVGVLALDLPGSGDSAGDFSEARWDWWIYALGVGADWLENESGRPISLCGLRLGAALALELARLRGHRFARAILLDPVVHGEQTMTQYLRLRVAFSGLQTASHDRRETTASLRRSLARGESIEVAGYILAPELVAAIDAVDLSHESEMPFIPVDWIESSPHPHQEMVNSWSAADPAVTYHPVNVKHYWTHTRANAPHYQELASTLERIVA